MSSNVCSEIQALPVGALSSRAAQCCGGKHLTVRSPRIRSLGQSISVPFCVKCVCSSRAFVGFPWVLWFPLKIETLAD